MKKSSAALRIAVWMCGLFTVSVLVLIILFIFVNGIPHINMIFLFGEYNSTTLSLLSPLVTTLQMIVLALAIALPIGLGTGIYLVEYSKKKSRFVYYINLATETLAAIPSIIYGLFGMIFFCTILKMGTSIIAGVLTLAIMILPIIIRSSSEALKSVPDLYREGSFGLGAGKIKTISAVLLPACARGIVSGVILSIGRIVGESAPLIFTSGTNIDSVTFNIFQSRRTLAIHMYMLASEGLPHSRNMAFATGAVLIVTVFIINGLASYFGNKFGDKNE